MNEAQAIQLCLKDKDPAGFEFLVEQYKREAYYHALSFTNNKEDAADVCQDAFRKAFAAMPRLETLDKFYPWFYRILKNHCINLYARKKTAATYRQHTLEGRHERKETTSPVASIEKREHQESVRRILATLKPDFREILTLKYFSEKNYQEISELLDIPRGTVMSRLYHARIAFRDAFQSAENSNQI